MRGLMQHHPLDINNLLLRVEENFAHKHVWTASPDGPDTTTSWGDVVSRSRRLGSALNALGAPRGSRIATLAWNSTRHVELYLAVPCSGRVLHTLNHRLHEDDLVYIVDHAADDIVFVDRTLLDRLLPILDRLSSVRLVVVMDDGAGVAVPDDDRFLDYELLLAGSPEHDLEGPSDEDDAASLCYTSGTTGRPKGVLYSHRSVTLHALMLLGADNFAISENDVVHPIVPMFHVNAWGLPYAAMLAGSDLVLPGPAMAAHQLARQLTERAVTFTAAVPTIWRALQPLVRAADVPNLRMVVCGGGATPDSLSRAWESAAGIPLTNAWGMTETSPVVTCSRIDSTRRDVDADERRSLLGTPGPNLALTRLRLVDDDGVLVPRDGVSLGELQVSGPTIASGYVSSSWTDDEVTDDGIGSSTPGARVPANDMSDAGIPSAVTADGWLRTGDVATIDEVGYLRIVDRTKDLVKSGGEWISSVTLENEIMAHPAVLEAAVIAIPDDRWGERPLACVVARPSSSVDSEDVRTFLRGRVASWWIPEQVWVLDEIPKTSTGKFSKLALRSLADNRVRTDAT